MTALPRTANHEVAIAAAGPAVSLGLAGTGLGLGAITGLPLLWQLGFINLIIAGFNLIPALPMDGGRILRALLTRRMDFVKATDTSVTVARVVAIAFGVFGIAAGHFQLVLLAPFLWMMGSHERRVARQMAHHYAYDESGYSERPWDEPEVMPRNWDGRGSYAPPQRFVIVQRGGRLVVEQV
jgi:Zn-dependent protease